MSAQWLYEDGIAEERAILVSGGTILSARVEWGEMLRPGLVAQARLAKRQHGSRRGVDRKSTRLNSSHIQKSRMPSSA